jgi:hypothetical protein
MHKKIFLKRLRYYFAEEIRPYIEKPIYECLNSYREHYIPLYIREGDAKFICRRFNSVGLKNNQKLHEFYIKRLPD